MGVLDVTAESKSYSTSLRNVVASVGLHEVVALIQFCPEIVRSLSGIKDTHLHCGCYYVYANNFFVYEDIIFNKYLVVLVMCLRMYTIAYFTSHRRPHEDCRQHHQHFHNAQASLHLLETFLFSRTD